MSDLLICVTNEESASIKPEISEEILVDKIYKYFVIAKSRRHGKWIENDEELNIEIARIKRHHKKPLVFKIEIYEDLTKIYDLLKYSKRPSDKDTMYKILYKNRQLASDIERDLLFEKKQVSLSIMRSLTEIDLTMLIEVDAYLEKIKKYYKELAMEKSMEKAFGNDSSYKNQWKNIEYSKAKSQTTQKPRPIIPDSNIMKVEALSS